MSSERRPCRQNGQPQAVEKGRVEQVEQRHHRAAEDRPQRHALERIQEEGAAGGFVEAEALFDDEGAVVVERQAHRQVQQGKRAQKGQRLRQRVREPGAGQPFQPAKRAEGRPVRAAAQSERLRRAGCGAGSPANTPASGHTARHRKCRAPLPAGLTAVPVVDERHGRVGQVHQDDEGEDSCLHSGVCYERAA